MLTSTSILYTQQTQSGLGSSKGSTHVRAGYNSTSMYGLSHTIGSIHLERWLILIYYTTPYPVPTYKSTPLPTFKWSTSKDELSFALFEFAWYYKLEVTRTLHATRRRNIAVSARLDRTSYSPSTAISSEIGSEY
jgi:hypothetical protein